MKKVSGVYRPLQKNEARKQLLAFMLGLLMMGYGQLNFLATSHAQPGTWRRKTDMPTPRGGLATSVVNRIIYAIGGWGGKTTVEAYDPLTNTWMRKADMPFPRGGLSASTVDGKIYAIGGEIVSVVEVYDPVLDRWEAKKEMSIPRSLLSTSVVNGMIYAIGGSPVRGNHLPTVEAYNPHTDTWQKRKEMPTSRGSLSTSVVNGKIYAIGGVQDDMALSTVEVYDPRENRWSERAKMPTPRFGLSTSVVGGKIYAIGGAQWDGIARVVRSLPTVEIYDPEKDQWKTGPELPFENLYFSTEAINGKIYTFGRAEAGHPNFGLFLGGIPAPVYELNTGLSIDARGKLPMSWGAIKRNSGFVR